MKSLSIERIRLLKERFSLAAVLASEYAVSVLTATRSLTDCSILNLSNMVLDD
jgi:hypothetical protein